MKDYIKQLIAEKRGVPERMGVVKEYLHARILQTLQESGVFENWAFLGGTALRFLYGLPRHSEDLYFSLVEPGAEAGFKKALNKVKSVFEAENYGVSLSINDRKTVLSAMIRFDGLLFDLSLSPRRTQALSVKIEVDTNPPPGASLESTLIRRHIVLNLLHHDRASLLSGKIHALWTRAYVKGRDLFDLIWYLADKSWPRPNLVLLNAALSQTGWAGERVTEGNWRQVIEDKVTRINWAEAREDVRPFLERENDIDFVTLENCLKLLGSAP